MFLPVVILAILAGTSTSLLGTFVVGMRIPFVGVCTAHAAMAGLVFAKLLGLPLLPCGIAAAAGVAALLARMDSARVHIDSNVALGILFALSMGLAFLGIGLATEPQSEMLSFLWGSLLFARGEDCVVAGVVTLATVGFIAVFYKEMQAILFSRALAKLSGVRVRLVWTLFLVLLGVVLTVNLRTVGGLMIYSLVNNPAASALQVCRSYRSVLLVSMLFGALSAMGGFVISYLSGLPTGACIVLLSSGVFGLAALGRIVFRKAY
jgi:manganese/iron transport system permease protein